MNLYYLRYFVTLSHIGHYTKAARELCITQPSLSHAIAELEKELGVALFEKSGRNTTLTRFGEEFLQTAEHTLSVLDQGVASLERSAKGEGLIRIGLLRTLGTDYVPRLAAAFLAENEGKDIHFTFETGVTKELIRGLEERRYDLVFCSYPQGEENLTATAVFQQKLVVIVPEEHELSSRSSITLKETEGYPIIAFTEDSGLNSIIHDMYKREDAKPSITIRTSEDEVIAGLVANGFGIAVVPYMEILANLPLKVLEITSPSYERNFYLVNDESIYMPPVVRSFREFVLKQKEQE